MKNNVARKMYINKKERSINCKHGINYKPLRKPLKIFKKEPILKKLLSGDLSQGKRRFIIYAREMHEMFFSLRDF